MPPKKQKTNLFSGGLLANTATEAIPQQEEEARQGQQTSTNAEDDPLFGNTQRVREITQKITAITDNSTYPKIALENLDDNPYQPRRRMNQKRLEALAREIRMYGFKGVLLARVHPMNPQKYQLVYGHRRREASRLAGLSELPVMIDTINDDEMKFLAVNENILRDDLTPLDEAYAYAAMLEEMSQDAIAERLGVSRGYIRNRLDILKAPDDVQDMVEEKPDTMKAVVYLKDVEEADIRKTAIQALKNEEVTINQLKLFIENLRKAKIPSSVVAPLPTQEVTTDTSAEYKNTNNQLSTQQEMEVQHEKHTTTMPSPTAETAGAPLKQTEPSLLQQSKEQTEVITDRTKVETFTKYLQKYEHRLKNRTMTIEEKALVEALIQCAQSILTQHS